MKKLAACFLAVCLLGSTALTVGAAELGGGSSSGDVAVTTQVPSSHTLTVEAEGAEVSVNGTAGESFTVDRLSQPELTIQPQEGYRITVVTLNGEDITDQVVEGSYLLPPVYENLVLTVTTEPESSTPSEPETPSEPGTSSPEPSEETSSPSQPDQSTDQPPQTGDKSNLLLGFVLLLISGSGMSTLLLIKKKARS